MICPATQMSNLGKLSELGNAARAANLFNA